LEEGPPAGRPFLCPGRVLGARGLRRGRTSQSRTPPRLGV